MEEFLENPSEECIELEFHKELLRRIIEGISKRVYDMTTTEFPEKFQEEYTKELPEEGLEGFLEHFLVKIQKKFQLEPQQGFSVELLRKFLVKLPQFSV